MIVLEGIMVMMMMMMMMIIIIMTMAIKMLIDDNYNDNNDHLYLHQAKPIALDQAPAMARLVSTKSQGRQLP